MEDLFGIVIFVIFAAVSVASKVMKKKEDRTPAPKYPGPVAGPGVPGFPRPAWPDGPRPAAAPPAAPRQTPREPEYGEGVPGGEGVGSGMEGPRSTSTEAEVERFTKESNRRLGDLARQAQPEQLVDERKEGGMDLAGAVSDRQAMARAIVLAEVLGKPKGLRRR